MNSPIFCTQKRSFLGLETDNEIKSQYRSLKKNPILHHKIHSIYFHRQLEDIMGYDIVNFVDGEIPPLKHGSVISCIAITPKGENINSYLISSFKNNRYECFIVIEEDIEETKKDLQI